MHRTQAFGLFFLCVLTFAHAKIYFSETFDAGWGKRWVLSTHKGADAGKFDLSAGKFHNDAKKDKGLHTTTDYRFYQISAKLFEEFDNTGKDLFFQFTVKHEQSIDCGGGYFKLLPAPLEQEDFSGDSAYNVMFGPDHCGTTKKTHVIFNYEEENHLVKKQVSAPSDTLTHLYQLHVKPDQTFTVSIDGEDKLSGDLLDTDLFDFLPPKQIPDPKVHKPSDWVDQKEIDDPEASKPAGWDEIPEQIQDPDAQKPDDWDEELDGEWEAPIIPNPDYKGEWAHPKIPNPAYKGEWKAPLIDNPKYKEDKSLYAYKSAYIGLEIWQVKAGTIFDNILVTDDETTAQEWTNAVLEQIKGEKAAYEKHEEEERKKQEEDRKKREAEEPESDDGDDDDEEEEEKDDHHGHGHDEL